MEEQREWEIYERTQVVEGTDVDDTDEDYCVDR